MRVTALIMAFLLTLLAWAGVIGLGFAISASHPTGDDVQGAQVTMLFAIIGAVCMTVWLGNLIEGALRG